MSHVDQRCPGGWHDITNQTSPICKYNGERATWWYQCVSTAVTSFPVHTKRRVQSLICKPRLYGRDVIYGCIIPQTVGYCIKPNSPASTEDSRHRSYHIDSFWGQTRSFFDPAFICKIAVFYLGLKFMSQRLFHTIIFFHGQIRYSLKMV